MLKNSCYCKKIFSTLKCWLFFHLWNLLLKCVERNFFVEEKTRDFAADFSTLCRKIKWKFCQNSNKQRHLTSIELPINFKNSTFNWNFDVKMSQMQGCIGKCRLYLNIISIDSVKLCSEFFPIFHFLNFFKLVFSLLDFRHLSDTI